MLRRILVVDDADVNRKKCADSIEVLDYQMQEIRNKIDKNNE